MKQLMSNVEFCERGFWVIVFAYVVMSIATALVVVTIVWAYLTHTSILLNITWYIIIMATAYALFIYMAVVGRIKGCQNIL